MSTKENSCNLVSSVRTLENYLCISKLYQFGSDTQKLIFFSNKLLLKVKTPDQILNTGRKTLLLESEALSTAAGRINQSFIDAIEAILQSSGRVVLSGVGKSALVGQKIVATLNSTGTPAIFMHAADAIHGDLGILQREDILICLSQSGNTSEIKTLVHLVRNKGNKIIAITGQADSFLAKNADYVLDSFVEREACNLNLAPTSSTTVQMALGDAIAVVLAEYKGFKPEHFAVFHPGGSIGKMLHLKVTDILDISFFPAVNLDSPLTQIVITISTGRKGAVAVLEGHQLVGIITDGDLRRFLGDTNTIKPEVRAYDLVSRSPKTISSQSLAAEALSVMKENKINQLIVVEEEKPIGILHIQEILSQGMI
jgi:arabinose-5-phosphate isomerase